MNRWERMSPQIALALVCLLLACTAKRASAADVAAGKALAQTQCGECHDADDWEGEDAASLQSLIHDIAAGKVKHKRKITLSDADIANVAAFWAQTGKK